MARLLAALTAVQYRLDQHPVVLRLVGAEREAHDRVVVVGDVVPLLVLPRGEQTTSPAPTVTDSVASMFGSSAPSNVVVPFSS